MSTETPRTLGFVRSVEIVHVSNDALFATLKSLGSMFNAEKWVRETPSTLEIIMSARELYPHDVESIREVTKGYLFSEKITVGGMLINQSPFILLSIER